MITQYIMTAKHFMRYNGNLRLNSLLNRSGPKRSTNSEHEVHTLIVLHPPYNMYNER